MSRNSVLAFLRAGGKAEPIEAGGKKRYNEHKKRTFGFNCEKTADGCAEITRAEYNKGRTLDEENIDGRAKRRISRVTNFDGSAEGNAAGHHNGNRHAAGAEILSRHTVGERLRNDTGGSVSSVDRDGTGVSDAIDLSREPETLNELRRQNTQLKKRVRICE